MMSMRLAVVIVLLLGQVVHQASAAPMEGLADGTREVNDLALTRPIAEASSTTKTGCTWARLPSIPKMKNMNKMIKAPNMSKLAKVPIKMLQRAATKQKGKSLPGDAPATQAAIGSSTPELLEEEAESPRISPPASPLATHDSPHYLGGPNLADENQHRGHESHVQSGSKDIYQNLIEQEQYQEYAKEPCASHSGDSYRSRQLGQGGNSHPGGPSGHGGSSYPGGDNGELGGDYYGIQHQGGGNDYLWDSHVYYDSQRNSPGAHVNDHWAPDVFPSPNTNPQFYSPEHYMNNNPYGPNGNRGP
ncbi:hypothetical protein PtA15_4A710 [Puccinia triticina]|uniref:Secreted protein n=1 Tax=Puccinia triticina TaxID=208348 RepID=A0ABY7CJW5_9BASI|nr:uncharacterized protein PtA15_4A710 [Puccinia triticina]WAQ84257.1 hypothetical protein PtA15_4A710 [Puccinia triticina]